METTASCLEQGALESQMPRFPCFDQELSGSGEVNCVFEPQANRRGGSTYELLDGLNGTPVQCAQYGARHVPYSINGSICYSGLGESRTRRPSKSLA